MFQKNNKSIDIFIIDMQVILNLRSGRDPQSCNHSNQTLHFFF
jgi:hypothetical protein